MRTLLVSFVVIVLSLPGQAIGQTESGARAESATLPPLPAGAATTEARSPADVSAPSAPELASEPAPALTEPSALPCGRGFRHDGFYMRLSSGLGYGTVFGDGPLGSASISGVASGGGLSVGGTIAPGVALAGTVQTRAVSGTFQGGRFAHATISIPSGSGSGSTVVGASADAIATLIELGILVDWFPDPSAGWHAGASLGLGGIDVTNQADGSSAVSAGLAGTLFGGYDAWLGRAWSLGVGGVAGGCTRGKLSSGQNDTGYSLASLSLGLEFSFLYY